MTAHKAAAEPKMAEVSAEEKQGKEDILEFISVRGIDYLHHNVVKKTENSPLFSVFGCTFACLSFIKDMLEMLDDNYAMGDNGEKNPKKARLQLVYAAVSVFFLVAFVVRLSQFCRLSISQLIWPVKQVYIGNPWNGFRAGHKGLNGKDLSSTYAAWRDKDASCGSVACDFCNKYKHCLHAEHRAVCSWLWPRWVQQRWQNAADAAARVKTTSPVVPSSPPEEATLQNKVEDTAVKADGQNPSVGTNEAAGGSGVPPAARKLSFQENPDGDEDAGGNAEDAGGAQVPSLTSKQDFVIKLDRLEREEVSGSVDFKKKVTELVRDVRAAGYSTTFMLRASGEDIARNLRKSLAT